MLKSVFLLATLALVAAVPILNIEQELRVEVGDLSETQVATIKAAIRAVIPTARGTNDQNKGDVVAGTLQLAFHDAGTYDKTDGSGGPDGCLDFSLGENKGLSFIMGVLSPVYAQFASIISFADFIVLAGNTGIEASLPAGKSVNLPFKYGRVDGTDCTTVDHDRLPEAKRSTEHVVAVFATRMGFTLQEITALMGAHSVGRTEDQNSGYNGPWDRTQSQLDNAYYSEIVKKPWDRQERTVNGVEHFNWIIPGPNAGATQMLNTDMCLAFDIGTDDTVNDGNTCVVRPGGRGICPPASSGTRVFVDKYIADQDAWLADFAAAFVKMTELGWEGKLRTAGDAAPAPKEEDIPAPEEEDIPVPEEEDIPAPEEEVAPAPQPLSREEQRAADEAARAAERAAEDQRRADERAAIDAQRAADRAAQDAQRAADRASRPARRRSAD